MKILILEDDAQRLELFDKQLNNDNNVLYFYDNVEEAYDALVEHELFDAIFFDNDLGDGGEGKQLAQLIQRDFYQEMEYTKELKLAVVHSMNVVAAQSIYEIMNQLVPVTYMVPFQVMLRVPETVSELVTAVK